MRTLHMQPESTHAIASQMTQSAQAMAEGRVR